MRDDALIEQILAEEDTTVLDETETVDNENIAEVETEEHQETSQEDVAQVGEVTQEVTQEVQPIIPDNWEQSLKDFVSGIEDRNGQMAIIDKLKNFETGYQKKFQSLSDERKQFEEERNGFTADKTTVESYKQLESSFAPEVHQAITQQFGSTTQYFNHLKEMDMAFSQDPHTFLLNMSNNAGIDLAQLAQMQKDPAIQQNYQVQQAQRQQSQQYDNKFKQLEEQLNSKFEELENNKFMAEMTAMKDEQGQLKYPHLSNDSVIDAMDLLANKYPDANFDTLYNESLYLVPDIRNGILNQNKVVEQQVQQTQQALAPKQVKSKVSSSETKRKMTDDELIDDILSSY
ncbi:MAG: hypothetical protein Unbinned6284contig1004_56 [Prokaryotic dsDNA virus sp.]|nr:MAG: hypothetical protein Unbinned6284contig1004_56 [Prokaryotic dsDNA virus sp.]|tara:strand:+ start:14146 stop:15180 length:1035 start_codon:yes stop_codon:yes gene_type:complete